MILLIPLLIAAGDIGKLDWFAGCHVMETPKLKIEEQWMKPEGGMMLGINRTVRAGKTVAHEFLRIDAKPDGAVVYTGLVGTKGETPFQLTSQTDSEVIFENPTHDFPQRILYRKTPEGILARIDGTVNGKQRAQEFPMKSVPCK
jgi:hypothetical protein